MHEIFITTAEVVHDFIGVFICLGALCAIIFGLWNFLSARHRWRTRQHCSNDYSSYIWPGENRLWRYACFPKVGSCLILAFAAFTTTFMVASIAAAMLALMLIGGSLPLCTVMLILAITVSSCAGYFGQCLLDENENQMLECAEVIAALRDLHRRTRRARRPILGHTQLTR